MLRNFRCKAGEIDLVMLDGATLVLVEVRYRSSDAVRRRGCIGDLAQAAPARECGRVPAARAPELRRYPARFDVVAISRRAPETRRIDWIKSAFTL